jgi:hypothetical protein
MRHGSRIVLCLSVSIIILTMAAPTVAMSQSQAVKTEDLIKRSDVIVVGKVGRMVSEWNEDKSRIQTRVTISVDQTIKGVPTSSTVTVLVPGGEVDGVGEWYSHTARFQDNEDVVIFAEQDQKGMFRVAGGDQGKLSLRRDKATGMLTVPNLGPLDQITQQLRSVVETQSGETLQRK